MSTPLSPAQQKWIKLLLPAGDPTLVPLAMIYWSTEKKDYAVVADVDVIEAGLLDGKQVGWAITKVLNRYRKSKVMGKVVEMEAYRKARQAPPTIVQPPPEGVK